jgi:hypothetical protein
MRFKINTGSMSEIEFKAMHAFFGVMAGAEQTFELGSAIPDTSLFSTGRAVQDFLNAVADEPAPPAVLPEVAEVSRDKDGLPWDERIHSSSKEINQDGTWRRRRKINDEYYNEIAAELNGKPQSVQDIVNALKPENTKQEPEREEAAPLPAAATVDASSVGGTNEPETSSEAAGDATSVVNGGDDVPLQTADAASDIAPSGNGDVTQASAETSGSGQTAASDVSPSDDVPPMSQEAAEFWHMINGARSWISFKSALGKFTQTDTFKAMSVDEQRTLRGKIWDIATNDVGIDVDHAEDPTAFSCWIFTQTDPQIITANFHVLKKDSAIYRGMADDVKARVASLVDSWIEHLKA